MLHQQSRRNRQSCDLDMPELSLLVLPLQGMQKNETDTDVRLAATVALYNALEFAHSNFSNDSERNYLMQVRQMRCQGFLRRS